MQVSIDALAMSDLRPFWCAVLGYKELADEDAVDPVSYGPVVTFQQMDGSRPQRNRIHIDVSVLRDQVDQRIATMLAAGGRIVTDRFAPHWWTLAAAEGNEVDLAAWADDRE